MQVDTYTDGTFRFVFRRNEKKFGIELLSSIKADDDEAQEQINHAIYRVLIAGVLVDKPLFR